MAVPLRHARRPRPDRHAGHGGTGRAQRDLGERRRPALPRREPARRRDRHICAARAAPGDLLVDLRRRRGAAPDADAPGLRHRRGARPHGGRGVPGAVAVRAPRDDARRARTVRPGCPPRRSRRPSATTTRPSAATRRAATRTGASSRGCGRSTGRRTPPSSASRWRASASGASGPTCPAACGTPREVRSPGCTPPARSPAWRVFINGRAGLEGTMFGPSLLSGRIAGRAMTAHAAGERLLTSG